jgi:hypothetical protein
LKHRQHHLSSGFTTFIYKHIYTSTTILSTSNRNYFRYGLVWRTVSLCVPNSIPLCRYSNICAMCPILYTITVQHEACLNQSTPSFASFQYNVLSYTIPDTYSYRKYASLRLLFTMTDNMFIRDIHTITVHTDIPFIIYYIISVLNVTANIPSIAPSSTFPATQYCNGFAQTIARQRLDKHPAIHARNNRPNVIARC